MDKKVDKYRYKCITTDTFVYEWLESTPSGCLHDAAHEISQDSISIVDTIAENIVKADIMTEHSPTGGMYRGEFIKVSTSGVAVGEWAIKDWSKPFDVSLLCASFNLQPENCGDELIVELSPDTIIGAISQPALSGAQTINVTQTVVDNMAVGFGCILMDGLGQKYNLGCVISMDAENLTLTVDGGCPKDFSPLDPTYVIPEMIMQGPSEIGGPGPYEMGSILLKGKRFPANTIFRIKYKNNDPNNLTKSLYIEVEYLY